MTFSNPMELKSDTRAALGLDSFPASDIPLPRTSFIPQCFYEKVTKDTSWNVKSIKTKQNKGPRDLSHDKYKYN